MIRSRITGRLRLRRGLCRGRVLARRHQVQDRVRPDRVLDRNPARHRLGRGHPHRVRIVLMGDAFSQWRTGLLELIRRTSCDLPSDMERALKRARKRERVGSPAQWALDAVLDNIKLARERGAPLCQDTGTLTFHVRTPFIFDSAPLVRAVPEAVREATSLGLLRQNTIESVSGRSCPDNLGPGSPVVHFTPESRRDVEIRLLMKGGGSENVSAQYSLPDARLGAGRDLEGVRRCVLDAVVRAQGNGCAPGVLGVCFGGDRASGMDAAKLQLLRTLDEPNPEPALAALEKRILKESSRLGIGPMGLGGVTTLLGVRIGALTRLPASCFVSIAYMCWAFRRQCCLFTTNGRLRKSLAGQHL